MYKPFSAGKVSAVVVHARCIQKSTRWFTIFLNYFEEAFQETIVDNHFEEQEEDIDILHEVPEEDCVSQTGKDRELIERARAVGIAYEYANVGVSESVDVQQRR